MNKIYALIVSGIVINTLVWDGEAAWDIPAGCILILAETPVGIGWSYDGEKFSPPENGQQ